MRQTNVLRVLCCTTRLLLKCLSQKLKQRNHRIFDLTENLLVSFPQVGKLGRKSMENENMTVQMRILSYKAYVCIIHTKL